MDGSNVVHLPTPLQRIDNPSAEEREATIRGIEERFPDVSLAFRSCGIGPERLIAFLAQLSWATGQHFRT